MEIYNLEIKTEEGNIVTLTKLGVVATAECGSYINDEEIPIARLTIVIQKNEDGVKAWVQYGRYNSNQDLVISHEGWIKEGDDSIVSSFGVHSLVTSLKKMVSVQAHEQESLENIKVGAFACCRAYGANCYVNCCNCCCSDPYGCPGARCCAQ